MKLKLYGLLVAFMVFAPLALAGVVHAETKCPDKYVANSEGVCVYAEDCDPKTEELAEGTRAEAGKYVCCPKGTGDSAVDCVMAKYINPAVRVLTALAGVAVVAGISIGGIQYAASGGDPQKTAAGKAKITKALLGLVGFMFLFSALQFMSPGGFSQKNSVPANATNKAAACSSTFFGLKPWFAYLPDENFGENCEIIDFNILPAENNPSDVVAVVLSIVDNLVRIAALVSVIFVVVGGAKYVTSQGEPEGVKSAKDSIINALIGLVIAIIAATVVSFIGNQLS
ncbi:MAG: pilin [Candidatus Saccharimonadales bacterium]